MDILIRLFTPDADVALTRWTIPNVIDIGMRGDDDSMSMRIINGEASIDLLRGIDTLIVTKSSRRSGYVVTVTTDWKD